MIKIFHLILKKWYKDNQSFELKTKSQLLILKSDILFYLVSILKIIFTRPDVSIMTFINLLYTIFVILLTITNIKLYKSHFPLINNRKPIIKAIIKFFI